MLEFARGTDDARDFDERIADELVTVGWQKERGALDVLVIIVVAFCTVVPRPNWATAIDMGTEAFDGS